MLYMKEHKEHYYIASGNICGILHFTQTIDELTCVYNKDFIKFDLLLVLTVLCGILTFNRLIFRGELTIKA